MKYQWTAISVLLTVSCLLLTAADLRAGASSRERELCNNLDKMRALEALARSQPNPAKTSTGPQSVNHNLHMLSQLSFLQESWILPYKNSARIARDIDLLLQKFEKGENSEAAQVTRFNIAYEYFLFYLSFLNENYLLDFQDDTHDMSEIGIDRLISEQELSQYLLQAQLYLQGLTSEAKQSNRTSKNTMEQMSYWTDKTKSASFIVRDNTALYMNANFLQFMIECEKMAGRFRLALSKDTAEDAFSLGMPDMDIIRYYDRSSWDWLNELWKRYSFRRDTPTAVHQKGMPNANNETAGFSTYCPSTNTLFRLYKIYLSYNFMWRYLADIQENSPYFNSLTRVLLQRLSKLHQAANHSSSFSGVYQYYHVESAKDAGQTNFLPDLFFARRGYFMGHWLDKKTVPVKLFALYGSFFKEAAAKIKNNISYRSRIYNELIIFGLTLNNLHLMENTLYQYALQSMRIEPQNDYSGPEFARSARLTTAFLLANILETKVISGLYQGCDRYRDLADAISPFLVSADNRNWQYATIIHYALARFYSQKEYFKEALAMYHAKQAFLIPCEKIAITYGQDQWNQFFQIPGHQLALSCLKMFLYFHNKYPTNPEAVIPQKYNAHKIVQAWITTRKNNFTNNEGELEL